MSEDNGFIPQYRGLKPWKKGQSGNPSGMTSETAARIQSNAEKATKIREALLDQLMAKLEAGEALELVSELNRLMRDTEDRGFGAPKQTTELEGGLEFKQITRRIVAPKGE